MSFSGFAVIYALLVQFPSICAPLVQAKRGLCPPPSAAPHTVQVPLGCRPPQQRRPSPQIRGTLKSWTRLWCVLKPGVLLIYKTPKVGQWVGTVLLHCCELIERPSKKDGFCFKLFHPLDQSVWAMKVRQRGTPGSRGSGPRGGVRPVDTVWEAGTGARPGGKPWGSGWAHHHPTAGGHGVGPSGAGDQMWSLALQVDPRWG